MSHRVFGLMFRELQKWSVTIVFTHAWVCFLSEMITEDEQVWSSISVPAFKRQHSVHILLITLLRFDRHVTNRALSKCVIWKV